MIPILYSDPTTMLGYLPDTLTCVVTEERNGAFELAITHPVNSPMFSSLKEDRLIKAKTNDTKEDQFFRIYKISKPINGIITVNAEHISYRLAYYPISTVMFSNASPLEALNGLLNNANGLLNGSQEPHGFTAQVIDPSGRFLSRRFKQELSSVRAALGGGTGSILSTYGGEFEFDNQTIKLHYNRGRDTGVIIAYGKNMTDVTVETSVENSYTAVFPYVKKGDTMITLAEGCISVENKSGINERIGFLDLSNEFGDSDSVSESAIMQKVDSWLSENDINAPEINVKVSFVNLWQSLEYSSMSALERVSLCDTVKIQHPDIGLDTSLKVIKTTYNTISEKYDSIELGTVKETLDKEVEDTVKDVVDDKRSEESENIPESDYDLPRRYLNSDTSDLYWIEYNSSSMDFVQKKCGAPNYQQHTNSSGELYYWTDNQHTKLTLQRTSYPAYAYAYTTSTVASFKWSDVSVGKTPVINNGTGGIKVIDNSTNPGIGNIVASNEAPANPVERDIWIDTDSGTQGSAKDAYIYSDGAWVKFGGGGSVVQNTYNYTETAYLNTVPLFTPFTVSYTDSQIGSDS